MPILQQPGAPSQVLVSVPVPTPVSTPAPRPKAPTQAPAQPAQQPDDESLFHPVASPSLMLLPHGPIAKSGSSGPVQQQRQGKPVKLGWRAPAGGQVVRGLWYQGGQMIPNQAVQTPVAQEPKKLEAKLEAKQEKTSVLGRLEKMLGMRQEKLSRGNQIRFAESGEEWIASQIREHRTAYPDEVS